MSRPDQVVRRRRPRTPSARVEDELLAAAEAVLRKGGLAGLTVRAVAAEAAIAPMAVYNRFGGKDGLITALQIRVFTRLRGAMEAADEHSPPARLRACCLRYREFALLNPHFYAILFAPGSPREHAPPGFDEHAEACLSVLVRNAELAAALGASSPPDVRGAALELWIAMHGAVTLELSGLVRTQDPVVTYTALLETLLRGQARRR